MLTVRNVSLSFGEVTALDGVDLTVAGDEVVGVVGPSGCGKTTLLRVVAGLAAPDRGRVSWDGADITPLAPHRREFGLMFQDYVLFPHLTVAGNVEFGLRMAGLPPEARRERVHEVLALVGLPGQESRRVTNLSGGEAQRVALARALAPSPRLLMLDEPLGSLDRALRQRLQGELRALFDRLDLPALYVTHDQEEAFAVADRLVIMRAGRVVQTGKAEEVWRAPADEFVARFLGFTTFVDATVGAGQASTPFGSVPVAAPAGTRRLVFRPDAFHLDLGGSVSGEVAARTFRGDHAVLTVIVAGGEPVEVASRGGYRAGDRVTLTVDPEAVVDLGPAP